MSTPETLKRPPQEAEKTEKSTTPETPETPVDMRSEDVEQYADTVADFVEQQAATITSGASEQINSSAEKLNLDKGVIEEARAESGVTAQLDALNVEGQNLAIEMRAKMTEAIADAPTVEAEPNAPASWKGVFETPAGEIFQKAMAGRAPDGKQDATRSRITNEFTMREFVRNHPAEAAQFGAIFQKEFGEPHDLLARATEQVQELKQTPPEAPAEDPKFAELSYALGKDPEFDKLRDELDHAHKVRVFGTTDFTTIPLGRFMDLCNTNENLTFSADREAEKEFRSRFPEKANLYDQREPTRIYRDPDGQLNIDRDPLYLKAFEADSRGIARNHEDALRSFARMYPEKAKGYAERYPNLLTLIPAPEAARPTKPDARLVKEKADKESADMAAFRERARRVKEGLPLEGEVQSSLAPRGLEVRTGLSPNTEKGPTATIDRFNVSRNLENLSANAGLVGDIRLDALRQQIQTGTAEQVQQLNDAIVKVGRAYGRTQKQEALSAALLGLEVQGQESGGGEIRQDIAEKRETPRAEGKMEASKDWSSADWQEQQREMKGEPYLASDQKTFGDIEGAFAEIERQNQLERTFERSPDAPYQSVDTRLIVRAPSLKNWGDSYHESHRKETSERGENAVIEIARKISANVNGVLENPKLAPENQQSSIDTALDGAGIFSDDSFPVYLKGHEGPRGPVYIVQDGSHRVAAAKLVGLDHVRGRVGGSPDVKTAKKVWYESLALMPEQARNAMRALYDQVHPPTAIEKIADDQALEEAKNRLGEIHQERDLNRQTMEQRASVESDRYKKVEAQFNDAKEFSDQVKDTKRFGRLQKEAGLQFLKENAPESLWEEYQQEIDDQGYLVRKDGKDSYTSSTGYDVGDSYRQIMISAVEAYRREFPAEQKEFLAKKAAKAK